MELQWVRPASVQGVAPPVFAGKVQGSLAPPRDQGPVADPRAAGGERIDEIGKRRLRDSIGEATDLDPLPEPVAPAGLARRIGMLQTSNPQIITGAELDSLDAQELEGVLGEEKEIAIGDLISDLVAGHPRVIWQPHPICPYPVDTLAEIPFQPYSTAAVRLNVAQSAGLPPSQSSGLRYTDIFPPGAEVALPPLIGGYIVGQHFTLPLWITSASILLAWIVFLKTR